MHTQLLQRCVCLAKILADNAYFVNFFFFFILALCTLERKQKIRSAHLSKIYTISIRRYDGSLLLLFFSRISQKYTRNIHNTSTKDAIVSTIVNQQHSACVRPKMYFYTTPTTTNRTAFDAFVQNNNETTERCGIGTHGLFRLLLLLCKNCVLYVADHLIGGDSM